MADRIRELQQQVLEARNAGQALRIVGGNSKAFMGREVAVPQQPLSLAQHSGILGYSPVELVLTARAGTPLEEIEAALAEHNQMLSFEPPRFGPGATLGGTLACNLSGPGRPWWNSVRDQVLGIRLLNGLGEELRFGGQVMKNVAGYDLARLQAGAMGTLGVITEISLKVLPRPALSRTLTLAVELDEALSLMNRFALEPKPLSGACWLDGCLYLRLSGAASAVEATGLQWQGEWLEEDDRFWQQLRDQQLPWFDGPQPLWRFCVNPGARIPVLDGCWCLDWGGAQRWYRGRQTLEELAIIAAEAGGQVCLFRGGERDGEVMQRPPAALRQLHRRLKQAFDPDQLFNPGRLYGWM